MWSAILLIIEKLESVYLVTMKTAVIHVIPELGLVQLDK